MASNLKLVWCSLPITKQPSSTQGHYYTHSSLSVHLLGKWVRRDSSESATLSSLTENETSSVENKVVACSLPRSISLELLHINRGPRNTSSQLHLLLRYKTPAAKLLVPISNFVSQLQLSEGERF